MWTEIKNELDIKNLMEDYDYFHDTCIRDIYITTEDFVDNDRYMCFKNTFTISMLFQRQAKNNSVLELKFESVKDMNINHLPHFSTLNDDEATLIVNNDLFYWANRKNWNIGKNNAMWISAEKIYWRFRPELIGDIRRINEE